MTTSVAAGAISIERSTVEHAMASAIGDSAARVRRPLDALNFFLADVRGGLGPYLAVYLLAERGLGCGKHRHRHVDCYRRGNSRADAGRRLVDAIRAKRALMVAAALAVTAASLVLPWLTAFWTVAVPEHFLEGGPRRPERIG